MFCSMCGKELPDDAVFCAFCGATFAVQNQNITYESQIELPKVKRSYKGIIIAAAAVVLVIISVIMFFMNQKMKEKYEQANQLRISGQVTEAVEIYNSILIYKDVKQIISDIEDTYSKFNEYIASEDYESAVSLLGDLGDYKDANTHTSEFVIWALDNKKLDIISDNIDNGFFDIDPIVEYVDDFIKDKKYDKALTLISCFNDKGAVQDEILVIRVSFADCVADYTDLCVEASEAGNTYMLDGREAIYYLYLMFEGYTEFSDKASSLNASSLQAEKDLERCGNEMKAALDTVKKLYGDAEIIRKVDINFYNLYDKYIKCVEYSLEFYKGDYGEYFNDFCEDGDMYENFLDEQLENLEELAALAEKF